MADVYGSGLVQFVANSVESHSLHYEMEVDPDKQLPFYGFELSKSLHRSRDAVLVELQFHVFNAICGEWSRLDCRGIDDYNVCGGGRQASEQAIDVLVSESKSDEDDV